jgi:hypothetical protein
MIENGFYALVGYIAGIVAILKTDWVVQEALRMQRKYPRAFSSRLAERSWYPNFIRFLGAILLLCAVIFTLELVFRSVS